VRKCWRLALDDLAKNLTFEEKLMSCECLDELYGFANRRKVLNTTDDTIAPRWTERERMLILARKYELEKELGLR